MLLTGVGWVHRSLVTLSRKLAWTSLPPDLVMVLTTPPPKRPYSADTAEVEVVVSWMASSMKRSNGWPRRFSLITTPLTMNRFSYDWLPAMLMPRLRGLRPGPEATTPGVRSTV